MAYSYAVKMSLSGGSLHVLQMEVTGMKMAAVVAEVKGEWKPSVNNFRWLC